MSTTSERYDRVASQFADVVAKAPDGAWDNASPCPGWSARDVVQHLVDANGMFLGFIGSTQPNSISSADDPAGAWAESRAAMKAHLDDPTMANNEFENFFGKHTLSGITDLVLIGDVLAHTSDLAKAIGVTVDLGTDDCAHALAGFQHFGQMLRNPRVFGPEVEVPDDASAQDKLLAYTGRQP